MIPSIIHHLWLGPQPQGLQHRQTWMEHNPTWSFMFWTGPIFTHQIPIRIAEIIGDRALHVVPRADLYRLAILHAVGGIYTDLDFICCKPMDRFRTVGRFIGDQGDNWVSNAIIGCEQGDPLIGDLMDKAAQVALGAPAGMRFHPDRTLAMFNDVKDQFTVYPPEFFYPFKWSELHRRVESFPEAFAIHQYAGMDPDGWTNQ